jgi:hypothetical protein
MNDNRPTIFSFFFPSSSAGRQFARGRGTFYLLIGGLLFVTVLIAFLISGKVSQHPILSFFYLGTLLIDYVSLSFFLVNHYREFDNIILCCAFQSCL